MVWESVRNYLEKGFKKSDIVAQRFQRESETQKKRYQWRDYNYCLLSHCDYANNVSYIPPDKFS